MDGQCSVVPVLKSDNGANLEKDTGDTFDLLNSAIAATAEASSRPKKIADHS